MTLRTPLITLCVVAAASALSGQSSPAGQAQPATPDALWRRANDAWDAGQYPNALRDLQALMKTAAAGQYLERVALLTGELFVTTEITLDGRNPKISGDGQIVTYETGPANDAVTRIVRMAATPQPAGEVRATNVVLDPAGARAAWIRSGTDGSSEIVVRDLTSGNESRARLANMPAAGLAWSGDGRQLLFIGSDDPARSDVFSIGVPAGDSAAAPVRLTDEAGFKTNLIVDPSGTVVVYSQVAQTPFGGGGGRGGGRGGGGGAAPVPARGGAGGAGAGGGQAGRAGGAPQGGGRGAGGAGAGTTYAVLNLKTKTTRTITGTGLTMSADGSTLAWITRSPDGGYALQTSPAAAADTAATIRTGRERINAPALSPDGKLVAYEYMQFTDWEIYVSDGSTQRRITREIPHDILPRFLTNTTLLAMTGEARHRRSFLYDLSGEGRTRLLHNNTIRTVVPEYAWVPSQNGRRVVIIAEKDGDTISPERGIYLVDLTRKVTADDVLRRLDRQLAAETDLRDRMTKAYAPIEKTVRATLARASVTRVWEHARALFDFDSKHISQPGNARAIDYLTRAYASFGYKPEQQWFSPANALGGKTANVVATLRGTVNPELIYVVSSHFDSVAVGPGADDDTSGTTALLEAARILADAPLPATVVFASFTGEEAGLLGSREFVRQAAQNKWQVVGALNNDMIGWAGESGRMDNTIRFSNAGIRDIQHGASFLFTDLILYDTKYYRSTDAQAFYDGWGDIVGGIGSYPILSNPNYHQPTDYLDTVNQRQVTETAKVTAATIMYLASSPSRLKDLKAARTPSGVEVTWTPSPESGVKQYIVAYGPEATPLQTRVTVTASKATLPALPAGTHIAVKAVNGRGLEGWDWVRTVVSR
ncbi:MAG TPA: M20/M25/M40 family metallo-hydrolase [Vicinamibacterales bacterium]